MNSLAAGQSPISLRTSSIKPVNTADAKDILRARARALTNVPKNDQSSAETLNIVEFRLAKECYAVEQKYVREVSPLKDLTAIPCTPPFILGIVNIRGQMLPVIDIKKFFDLPNTGITDLHLVIVIHHDNIELGILADAVTGSRLIAIDSLQKSLPTLNGIRAQYLKGITDYRTIVLDTPSILSDPKVTVDESVEM